MNPAIIVLIVIWLILLWLFLGHFFKPIGKVIIEIINGAFNPMFKKDNSKEDNENEGK